MLGGLSFSRIITGLLVGVAFIAFFGDAKGMYDAHLNEKMAFERSKIVMQLNDRTLARHVQFKADTDSLGEAVAAADALNGELVAALAIRTIPDTVYVPIDTVTTQFDTTSVGVTRTASLTDTTDLGIEITVEAEAPPMPAALKLGYKVVVPEFRPEIGFVETDDGIFATVSWADMEFNVEAPFFRPPSAQHKPLRLNAGARLFVNTLVPDLQDLLYAGAYLEAEYTTMGGWSLQVPVGVANHGLFTGVELERNLAQWSGLFDMLWPF